ncbi:MAG: AEC family transporter [Clostridia bacterium]|nr:AEC family transporter [Clostridia bacterium]
MAVLQQVVVLFLMAALGFLLTWRKVWNDHSVKSVTSMVILISTPCLNFSKLYHLPQGTLSGDWLICFFLSMALTSVMLGIGFLIFRKHPKDERAVFAQLTALSNYGFMGYPVMEAAFGDVVVGYGVAFVTAFNIVSWSIALALFCKDFKAGLKKMVNPTMGGIALALVLQLLNWQLPKVLVDVVDAMSALATPLAMMVAGAYFGKITVDMLKNKSFLLTCFLRLIVMPLFCLGVLKLCGMTGEVGAAIFVACCMPGASNTLVQATAYSTDHARELAVGAVALTTILCVGTIPLMMLLW